MENLAKNINYSLNSPLFSGSTWEQFLLLILRGTWDITALELARKMAVQANLEWEKLQKSVDDEALAPLIYHIVRNQNIVPKSLEEKWRSAYYQNACRNTLLLRELAQVLHKLAAAGIDAIALKGAALAELVYGDIAARPMSDLDLLIQIDNLTETRQVLTSLGYSPVGVDMQTGFTDEFRNEEILYKQGLVDIYIDLHWRLIAPIYYQRTLTTDWFWKTAISVEINKAPALVLGCEAELVYLCAHLMLHHGGKSLLWLHDVAAVIIFYKERINWEIVLNKAQEYNLMLSVQQILLQVADKWNAPIPAEVIVKLEAFQPSRDEVRTSIWQHQIMALRLFDDVAGAKEWRQRFRIAWDTLFPNREYMLHRYKIPHPLLVPLYYPYRWMRGFRRLSN